MYRQLLSTLLLLLLGLGQLSAFSLAQRGVFALDSRSLHGVEEENGPNCALLDDPAVRIRMSGAFETILLRECGRFPDRPGTPFNQPLQ